MLTTIAITVAAYCAALQWRLRVYLATKLIGQRTAAFNLTVDSGSIVLSGDSSAVMVNVRVLGADTALRVMGGGGSGPIKPS